VLARVILACPFGFPVIAGASAVGLADRRDRQHSRRDQRGTVTRTPFVGRCRVCRTRGAQRLHGHPSRDSLQERPERPSRRMPQACDQCTRPQCIETGVSTVSPGEVQALRGSVWMQAVSACPKLGCTSNSGSTPPSRSGPRPGHRCRRKSGTGDPVDDPPNADRRPGTSLEASSEPLGDVTSCAHARLDCHREDP
jgi:hypothetical protein